MISTLKQIFGSQTKALEMLYLLNDLKPVVRFGFFPHELAKIEEFCKEKNLFLQKSPFKVTLTDKDRFSNEGKITNTEDNGLFLVYISKDQRNALFTCLYETQGDHYIVGKRLGYPNCCCTFFTEEFKKGNLNPMHKPTNPWTNLALREKDIVLISHFPCSSDCKESIEIAKKNYELIRQQEPERADKIVQALQ